MSDIEETALIQLDDLNKIDLFSTGGVNDILAKIEKHYTSEINDPSTTKGQERIKSAAYDISRTKTALDKMGKDLADSLNAQLKPINGERKKAREFLDDLKIKIRLPVTKMEDAEKQRKLDIEKRIFHFHYLETETMTTESVKAHIEKLRAIDIDASFQEYEENAKGHRESEITRCNGLLYEIAEREKIAAAAQAELEEKIRKQMEIQVEAKEKLIREENAKELAELKEKINAQAKAHEPEIADPVGQTLHDTISDAILHACCDMSESEFEDLVQDIEKAVVNYYKLKINNLRNL